MKAEIGELRGSHSLISRVPVGGGVMRASGISCRLRAVVVGFAAAACAVLLTPIQASAQAGGDLDTILQKLETYANNNWNREKVPGFAYAVVKGSETVYARGFGKKSQYSTADDVDEHTLFEIGSCTKAFNATVLGTVVDEGTIAWSDKVLVYLPDFKMNDPWVTKEFLVEDLLAQRSGMPPYSLDTMSLIGFNRADIMRATRWVTSLTSFRSAFGYQNNLHLWAAELIEKKTGLAWEEAVQQRILGPLGMTESTFDFATYDANPDHALGHQPLNGGGLWTIPPDWPYRGWVLTYAPAGGLCSSVADMAKWVALQLGNGCYGGVTILKVETLQAIRAPRIYQTTKSTGVSSYAMGWGFQSAPQTRWYVHDGETTGMHSIVAIYPDWDLGLVVLTNASGHILPECMAFGLLNIYTGVEPHDCPSEAVADLLPAPRGNPCDNAAATGVVAAIPPAKLAGTYENPAYGRAAVKKEASGLTMTLGPAKRFGQLTPVDVNKYSFEWPDWPGMSSCVVFKADASGNVTKLTILELSDVRGGDFKRVDR